MAANRIGWIAGGFVLVVAAICVSLLRGQIVDTKEMDAHARLKTLRQALELYKAQHGGTYPSSEQSMMALCDQPGQRGYLTCPHALNDPWGNPYVYRPAEAQRSYQLYSRGSNGIDEGGRGDDIIEPGSH